MNGPTLVAIGIIVGLVISLVVALLTSRRLIAVIRSRFVQFAIRTEARVRPAPESSSPLPKRRTRAVQNTRAWMRPNWRVAAMLSSILIIIVAPSGWWLSQPERWRTLVSYRWSRVLELLLEESRDSMDLNTRKDTLDELTQAIKDLSGELEVKHHRVDIWVVDHHWRYWLSDSLLDYRDANTEFVKKGGYIHRMFVLDESDIANPDLKEMLRNQCLIAQDPASHLVGVNFDLRLARRRDIKSSKAYAELASRFRHFENFDLVQFSDALYFSDSFPHTEEQYAPKENLGSSHWDFGERANIHLESLFDAEISKELECDHFEEAFENATSSASDATAVAERSPM